MKVSKGADFGDDRERYGMTHPESVPLRVPKLDELRSQNTALRVRNAELEVSLKEFKGAFEKATRDTLTLLWGDDNTIAYTAGPDGPGLVAEHFKEQRDRALSELAEKTRDLQETCAREGILTLQLAEARKDTERLDWLERRRLALNANYKTQYGWKFVSSHNVNRLFVRDMNTIDLNDAEARAGNIREAIDAARAAIPENAPNTLASSEVERDVKSPVSGADQ